MRQSLHWINKLMKSSENDRKKAVNIAKNGILKYENGVDISKKGKELIKLLENHCKLIGFCPHISYVKAESNKKDDLNYVWVHPFGQRTLVYKHKEFPILIIANSSIELNKSALTKIKGNESASELFDILGITG